MSRPGEMGREARQRLPGSPDAAGKAVIDSNPSTLATTPKKPEISVKPASGGSPVFFRGRPASVFAMLMVGPVSVLTVPVGWRLAWFISQIEAAGVMIERASIRHDDQTLTEYRLAGRWVVDGG